MRQLLNRFVFLIVIACFFTSLLRITSLLSSQLTEEQIEVIVKYSGNEEEKINFSANLNFFKNLNKHYFSSLFVNQWCIKGFLIKNYLEPTLDNPFSPPELNV